jgi:alcohol dehydrogenase YqhD (iron-dependent ADH family)
MRNFEFLLPTKVYFGRGTHRDVGAILRGYGAKKVLLHYGGGSIRASGLYDAVVASLRAGGIGFVELGGVKPNPRLSLVYEGICLGRQEGVDFILAVGGGSVIDSAKAIGLGLAHPERDVYDFYLKKASPGAMMPVGVVLTIPAAGSETSSSSVISREEDGLKRACGSEVLRPAFAILNPELTYTLPPYQTACGVADMMATSWSVTSPPPRMWR